MAKQIPREQVGRPGGHRSDKQEPKKLEKTTLRLHPDLVNAIERKAAADRRTLADVYRDLLAKGLAAEGIYL